MSNLSQAIEQMRDMREAYNELAKRSPLEWTNIDEAVSTVDEIASKIYVVPNNHNEDE